MALQVNNQEIMTPRACILLLTLECSLRCKMCHLWMNNESNIIKPNLDEWKEFILSLRKFSNTNFNVIFGGGEPLLLPDVLMELIAFCRQNGLRTSLATSGYFINENLAECLVSSGLDYIALTLYSLKEETHNLLRGVPDSYERLFQAIAFLNKLKGSLEIAIDTVIMEPNIKELLELARWVKMDSRIHSLFLQAVVQPFHSLPLDEWHKSEEYNFLWPENIQEVDSLIEELIKLKHGLQDRGRDKINNPVSQLNLFKQYFRNPRDFVKKISCNLIHGDAFTVSPDGNVNLCPYMKPIGNIKDGNIKDIWNSEDARYRRQEILFCKKNCHHIINCWYEEEKVI